MGARLAEDLPGLESWLCDEGLQGQAPPPAFSLANAGVSLGYEASVVIE